MEDILTRILSQIDAGSAFKTARLVCVQWRDITKKLFPDGHLKFANHLQTIIEKVLEHNNKPLDRDPLDYLTDNGRRPIILPIIQLSSNPNITLDFMKKHPKLGWDLDSITTGPNMVDELVDWCISRKIRDITSTKLSWESIAKIGFTKYQNYHFAHPITPEIFQKIEKYLGDDKEVIDNFIAIYGNEELIMQKGVCKCQFLGRNYRVSIDFILEHGKGFAKRCVIMDNFILLYNQQRIDYKITPDKLLVSWTGLDNSSTFTNSDNSSTFTNSISEEFYFEWRKVPCEIHRFVKKYCLRCATMDEIKKWITNNNVNWSYLSVYNHYGPDYYESLDISDQRTITKSNHTFTYVTFDDTHYKFWCIRYGSFEIIKEHFSDKDYTKNLNVPLQYILEHNPGRESICSRPDLTWDVVVNNLTAEWINWKKISKNHFGKKVEPPKMYVE